MALSYNWDTPDFANIKLCVSDAPGRMGSHCQAELEFMYFFSTPGCVYRINGRGFAVGAGDLVVANSWEYHSCDDFGAGTRVACLIVDPGMLLGFGGMAFENLIRADAVGLVFDKLVRILSERGREDTREGFPDATLYRLCGAVYELFTMLGEIKALRPMGEREIMMRRVIDYADANLSRELTIGELAGVAALSKDRFSHVFREVSGISPGEYLIRMRISRACRMLTLTDEPITRIALDCGFSSPSHFAMAFGKRMGVTPTFYRENKNNGFDI